MLLHIWELQLLLLVELRLLAEHFNMLLHIWELQLRLLNGERNLPMDLLISMIAHPKT
jgi:hypothetical protein